MWEWTAIRNFIWKFDSLWNSDDVLILASTARECWILYSAFAWSRFAIIVVLKVSTTDAGTVFEHFNNYFQTSWVPLERLCWYVLFWIGGIHMQTSRSHITTQSMVKLPSQTAHLYISAQRRTWKPSESLSNIARWLPVRQGDFREIPWPVEKSICSVDLINRLPKLFHRHLKMNTCETL
jgi:hypothetical protein